MSFTLKLNENQRKFLFMLNIFHFLQVSAHCKKPRINLSDAILDYDILSGFL